MNLSHTILVAALLLCASAAQSAVIDFEDVATGSGTITTDGDIVSGGFNFDSSSDHLHRINNAFADESDSGSTWLGIHDFGLGFPNNVVPQTLTLSMVGGGTFSLGSAQFAELFTSNSDSVALNATSITLLGNLQGGGTIGLTINLDGISDGAGGVADFQSVNFAAGWTNLTSVVFDGVGGGEAAWGIDNINTSPTVAVPEPGSLALLGLAFAGLRFTRRKKA